MIDTAKNGYNGGKSQAEMLILKYMLDRGIKSLDTLIVTHFDNDHCGGAVDLMKYGFEVLIEAGYPPEMAYFECIHELKLIVDLIYEGGIQRMNSVISNTAEWGEYVNGPKILPPDVKARMKESLRFIESGEFAKEWIAEARSGAKVLRAKREELGKHPAEIVGKRIRSLFEKK